MYGSLETGVATKSSDVNVDVSTKQAKEDLKTLKAAIESNHQGQPANYYLPMEGGWLCRPGLCGMIAVNCLNDFWWCYHNLFIRHLQKSWTDARHELPHHDHGLVRRRRAHIHLHHQGQRGQFHPDVPAACNLHSHRRQGAGPGCLPEDLGKGLFLQCTDEIVSIQLTSRLEIGCERL